MISNQPEANIPRAVEELVAAFVQLYALAVKLFLHDERTTTHILHGIFEELSWSFAEHGGESAE